MASPVDEQEKKWGSSTEWPPTVDEPPKIGRSSTK